MKMNKIKCCFCDSALESSSLSFSCINCSVSNNLEGVKIHVSDSLSFEYCRIYFYINNVMHSLEIDDDGVKIKYWLIFDDSSFKKIDTVSVINPSNVVSKIKLYLTFS